LILLDIDPTFSFLFLYVRQILILILLDQKEGDQRRVCHVKALVIEDGILANTDTQFCQMRRMASFINNEETVTGPSFMVDWRVRINNIKANNEECMLRT
jgi:hypothetical protein